MSNLPDFLRPGDDAESISTTSGQFIKLQDGDSVDIIPLTGFNPPKGEEANGSNCAISYNRYVIWMDEGKRPKDENGEPKLSPMFPQISTDKNEDPGAVIGYTPRFCCLLIVLKEEELSSGRPREYILDMTVTVYRQFKKLEEAFGSIKGKVLRLSREGTGLKTRYTLMNVGRTVNISGEPTIDLTDFIGPSTREGIIEELEEFGLWPPEGGDPLKKSKKPEPLSIEIEEDDGHDDDGDGAEDGNKTDYVEL